MCKQPSPWEKCVEFHGHICPGLMIGFKVATIAMEELQLTKARDEELFVVVENQSCAVDAIQVLTGCTFGKGNLFHKDHGKQVYTVANRRTGEAIRIAVRPNLFTFDPQYQELKDKVRSEALSEEENNLFIEKQLATCQQILDLSNADFCKLEHVSIEFPATAQMHETVICHKCGEGVMAPKAQKIDGQTYCIDCA